MRTARDRLEFAFRFAEVDLAALRPGDWMNLREDLESFHGYGARVPSATAVSTGAVQGSSLADLGGITGVPLAPPLPRDFSEDDFRALQAGVRGLLGGQGLAPMKGNFALVLDTIPIEIRLGVIPFGGGAFAMLSVTGKTRDVTLFRLAVLITQHVDKIRRCPDRDCQRLFYRVRRQLYCSKSCVARANKRAERAQSRLDAADTSASAGRARDARSKKPRRARRKKGGR